MMAIGVEVVIGVDSLAKPIASDQSIPFWYTAADQPIFWSNASNSLLRAVKKAD
jgi:hypothetical protein